MFIWTLFLFANIIIMRTDTRSFMTLKTTRESSSLLHVSLANRINQVQETLVYWAKTQRVKFHVHQVKVKNSVSFPLLPYSRPSALPLCFSLFIFFSCTFWYDSIWKSKGFLSLIQFILILCNKYLLNIFISNEEDCFSQLLSIITSIGNPKLFFERG